MTEPAVLIDDPRFLVVAKPAEWFTLGGHGEPSVEGWLRRRIAPDDPASAYVGIVHRLDRPVSGVLLMAREPGAARRLSRQFEARRVEKEYWAIVESVDPSALPPSGTWEDWLAPTNARGFWRVRNESTPGAKLAVTRYAVATAAGSPPDSAWLRMWPETGRTHQLRLQAAARGLPILGDALHGATRDFPLGIALHAARLVFEHPGSGVRVEVVASPPPTWAAAGFEPGPG